jgi:hypothetical protein
MKAMEHTDLSTAPAVIGAFHLNSAVILVEQSPVARTFMASTRETHTQSWIDDLNAEISLPYMHAEFPSLRPQVYSSISNSVGMFFVSFLPQDVRIRSVLWAFEAPFLRIWTVIDEPDFGFEQSIYEAERCFLDKLDDVACDFTVVYAFGKPLAEIRPEGSISLR